MGFEMFKSGKLHFSKIEVDVIRCLADKKLKSGHNMTELIEITQSTMLRDQDEILRALYTLEGKALVSPEPEGDFTSTKWKITDAGMGTLEVIENSLNSNTPKKAA